MNWGGGDVGCRLLFSYCRGRGAWNLRLCRTDGFSEQGEGWLFDSGVWIEKDAGGP